MSPRGIFITGTSTGVGKTVVTAALLRLARRRGVRCVGLKPVASGSERAAPAAPLRNADALELQAAGALPLPYGLVNPWCFAPAVAPHLAAREAGREIRLADLEAWYAQASAGADLALVEGAGGWRVPLHPAGYLSDLPEALGLDVVLVVGLTLGCLNHAVLTAEAIERGGRCRLLGWVANAIDPAFARLEDNVATLTTALGSPPLARLRNLQLVPRSPFGNPVAELPGDDARLAQVLGAG
jgi:dethiobiotin synthetase